ncbi:hypothetical protein CLV25_109105 [Acetobacteroides hydrogenigenes]|uniref:Hydrolase n=2 Tax=Acetobacteroides hydrogenigenes TaxID=979970 RepID=A0A4R2EGZ8_9BACT|nr:hypothetical protein CLV25_109105 [Acetobacteroides hydrogenigenes]
MYRIAVDFDGTIVENKYPKIGKPLPFAFETLKAFQKKGCVLILWTCREGELLDEAVEFCRRNGVEFYAVNQNHPEEAGVTEWSRKVDARYYIDDRGIPPFQGWGETFQMIFPDEVAPIKRKRFFLF